MRKIVAMILVVMLAMPVAVFGNTTSVSTRQATNITATGARITVDMQLADAGFAVLERGVLVSTNQHDMLNNTGTRVPTTNFGATNFEVELTGLISGVEYFVKGYIRYRSGGSIFAQERIVFDPSFVRFSTGGVAGMSVSRPQATTSGSNTTLEVHFSAPGAQIVTRGFAISTTNEQPAIGGAGTTVANATQHTNTWFTNTSNNLTQGQRYFVRAFIQLQDGQIVYSEVLVLDGQGGGGQQAFQGVNTRIATFQNLIITMRGSFNRAQFSNVTEHGFVVSSANSTPTTTNGTRVPSASNLETNADNIAADWTIGSTASVYYVRSYIISNNTPHYGNVIRVEIGTDTPVVFTRSSQLQNNNEARVVIDVIRAGASGILERGIVYSDTVADPQNMRANVQSRSISGTLGEGEVVIQGLVPGARYFIRAFARNEHGTSYGQVIEMLAVASDALVTLEPENIQQNSLTARATISGINQAIIREKGFVYSAERDIPTLAENDPRVSTTAIQMDGFQLGISGLSGDTSYNIRAFITTETGTIYGNVISARTAGAELQLLVNFQSLAGQSAGSQQLQTHVGQVLTASNLQLPQGYELVDSSWTHTVAAGQSTISVAVSRTTRPEAAFVAGTGNMTFSPNRAATRAEVAQMIYNLSADSVISSNPINFSDVAINHPNRRAIDYVSSQLYMRGYPDGSFQPEASITRAEMTVVLSHVYNLLTAPTPPGASQPNFSDVNSAFWGYRYIAAAFAHRMIYGYPDGTFLPNNDITRAEVTTLFVNSEGRSRQPLGAAQFTDVPPDHWAFDFIMNAAVPH